MFQDILKGKQMSKATNLYKQLSEIQSLVDALLLAACAEDEGISTKIKISWPYIFELVQKELANVKELAGDLENDIRRENRIQGKLSELSDELVVLRSGVIPGQG